MRFIFPLLVLLAASAFSEDAVKPETLGYKPVWSDEFNGTALDAAKWITSYAPKVHPLGCNSEKQSYAPENAVLRDGHLVLRAERKVREGVPFTISQSSGGPTACAGTRMASNAISGTASRTSARCM